MFKMSSVLACALVWWSSRESVLDHPYTVIYTHICVCMYVYRPITDTAEGFFLFDTTA
jgi:hypothetical protein